MLFLRRGFPHSRCNEFMVAVLAGDCRGVGEAIRSVENGEVRLADGRSVFVDTNKGVVVGSGSKVDQGAGRGSG